MPYELKLAENGWRTACPSDAALANGLSTREGAPLSDEVAADPRAAVHRSGDAADVTCQADLAGLSRRCMPTRPLEKPSGSNRAMTSRWSMPSTVDRPIADVLRPRVDGTYGPACAATELGSIETVAEQGSAR